MSLVHVESILKVIVENFKNLAKAETNLLCSIEHIRIEVPCCPARFRIHMTLGEHFSLTSHMRIMSTSAFSSHKCFFFFYCAHDKQYNEMTTKQNKKN